VSLVPACLAEETRGCWLVVTDMC